MASVLSSFRIGRPFASMPLAQLRFFRNCFASSIWPLRAIEHVEEAVAIGLDQQLAWLPLPGGVDQHRRLLRIPVVDVVRRELEIPAQLPGLRFEREHRVGVEIVALPLVAVVIEPRVAGRPVHEIELRIVSAGHPAGAAAMLGLFALPGFGARFAGIRHRPEAPHFLAGRRVIGGDESAHAFVAAGGAGDHQIARRPAAPTCRCSSRASRPSRCPTAARR